MPSPYKTGRPKGALGAKNRAIKEMLDKSPEVIQVVIKKALDGDISACSLILSRVIPTLAATSEKVQLNLDPTAPLTEQVQAVLSAVAKGEVASDVAKRITEIIGALGAIQQFEQFENRLRALEEAQ